MNDRPTHTRTHTHIHIQLLASDASEGDRERLLGLAVLSFLGHENLRDANALMDVRM